MTMIDRQPASMRRRLALTALAAAPIGAAISSSAALARELGAFASDAAGRDDRRAGSLSVPVALPADARAADAPKRIVVLNWGLTEMLLSLGVTPVGVPAPAWYVSGFVEPPLPPSVVDIGLLFQPNYDLLYELKPELILITPAHASVRASFERIAPTMTLGSYAYLPHPYTAMCGEFMTLARRLGLSTPGQSLLDATNALIERTRALLAASAPAGGYRDVCLAELVDDRHLRVFGSGSQFDDIVRALGLRNAAAADSTREGHALITSRAGNSVIELDALAPIAHAKMLWVGTGAHDDIARLSRNPVWQRLPMSRPGNATELPVIASTGALVSMQRLTLAIAGTMRHDAVV